MHGEGNPDEKAGGNLHEGRVVRLVSRGCILEGGGGEKVRCEIRGAVKGKKRTEKHPVAVGDLVQYAATSAGEGVIEAVLPRRTSLSRRTPGKRFEQVLAANADAVLAITATKTPPFRPGLVDRVLVAAEAGGLEGWVCLNKMDLMPDEPFGEVLRAYRSAGYRVFETSALTGEGVEALGEAAKGRCVVFIGHSGVGKSSLLNLLRPGLDLEVGEISRKTKRGVHTTSRYERFELGPETHVIDTPGVREFHPFGITPENLWTFFPEIRERGGACRFRDCRHAREKDCAVLQGLDAGEVDPGRHARYLKILDSLLEEKRDR
ncbi:MAG: ribosome small subunit-dependent GTPase A [Planctomycetota bacterium]|jgi:ribosome biogenesis GTPase